MIYFIQNTVRKSIKIGVSSNPRKRLATLQTAHCDPLKLIGVIPGGLEEESELHDRFAPLNLTGEWFRGDPSLLEAIEDMTFDPPRLFDRPIRSVYLAGKITENFWRMEILGGNNPLATYHVDDEATTWHARRAVAVPGTNLKIDYLGPFWLDLTGGGHATNPGAHAFSGSAGSGHKGRRYLTDGAIARFRCKMGVANADLVFAWIEDATCFGTLAEISWAFSRRLTPYGVGELVIVIATPNRFDASLEEQMWFIFGMADRRIRAVSAGEAWQSLWLDYGVPTNRSNEVVETVIADRADWWGDRENEDEDDGPWDDEAPDWFEGGE